MGQLTCFVVVCHILLEAMSLSKIELRQLVGKTSHSVTLSEIPHWHHREQLPRLPPPVSAPSFPSAIWTKSTQPIIQGKKKCLLLWAWFTSTESPFSNLLVLLLCGHPPGREIYSRSLLEAQSRYFYSFLRITISSHQVWLMKNPLIWLYLLCFSGELPFQGFKIRLVAVAAFPVAS